MTERASNADAPNLGVIVSVRGSVVDMRFDGRRNPRQKSWGEAVQRCGRLSASICSYRSFAIVPNCLPEKTRAAWRQWNAPTGTSTNCWQTSTAIVTVYVEAASMPSDPM